jgi:hypothetical protein
MHRLIMSFLFPLLFPFHSLSPHFHFYNNPNPTSFFCSLHLHSFNLSVRPLSNLKTESLHIFHFPPYYYLLFNEVGVGGKKEIILLLLV